MGFKKIEKTTFVNVVGGKFRITTEESTEGATCRTLFDKEGNKKGVRWELVYDELVCFLKQVKHYDGKFGRETQVVCETEDGDVLIQLPQGSKYASDFLKRLPNVAPEKYVVLRPFDFENDKNRKIQGISIYQEGKKVTNYYRDEDNNDINGIPSLKKKDIEENQGNSNFWKYWFGEEYKFLLEKAEALNLDVPRENEIPNVTAILSTKKAHDKAHDTAHHKTKDTVQDNLNMLKNIGKEKDVAQDFDPSPKDDLPF